jgi:hypothetical protein
MGRPFPSAAPRSSRPGYLSACEWLCRVKPGTGGQLAPRAPAPAPPSTPSSLPPPHCMNCLQSVTEGDVTLPAFGGAGGTPPASAQLRTTTKTTSHPTPPPTYDDLPNSLPKTPPQHLNLPLPLQYVAHVPIIKIFPSAFPRQSSNSRCANRPKPKTIRATRGVYIEEVCYATNPFHSPHLPRPLSTFTPPSPNLHSSKLFPHRPVPSQQFPNPRSPQSLHIPVAPYVLQNEQSRKRTSPSLAPSFTPNHLPQSVV